MAAKNAAQKTWSVAPSADGRRWSGYPNGDKPTPPPLPSWVPAPGETVIIYGGGSILTNNWRNVFDPAALGYVDSNVAPSSFSGSALVHPTWRTHGGLIVVGGNEGSSYNGGNILTFAESTMYWENLWTPTDWAAGLNGEDISAELNAHDEVTGSSPLRLGPGTLVGAAVTTGDLVLPMRQSLYIYTGGSQILQTAHEIDLSNPTTSSAVRPWVRRTASIGTLDDLPLLAGFAQNQQRFYILAEGEGGNLKWFDLATNTYVTGTNADWGYPNSDRINTDMFDPDAKRLLSGVMVPVPERSLLLACYRDAGSFTVQYVDTTQAQPTVATATLGRTVGIGASAATGTILWCKDSARLLLFGADGLMAHCVEIEIPTLLTATWPVEISPIGGDGIPWPSGPLSTNKGLSCAYVESIRCCVLQYGAAGAPDSDQVLLYRPRGT